MAVDTRRVFWLRSLLTGRIIAPPAVRLFGTASPLRAATHSELEQVRRSVRKTQWSKGGKMVWSDFGQVRDVTFTGFLPVRYPVMMEYLWPNVSLLRLPRSTVALTGGALNGAIGFRR